ncbi:MAG: elongation factor G [Defluviitaleaceae bacterium]|nr:elongation factor G [Defluviitaleaceae bacterium]
MKVYSADEIRNVAIMGHSGCGKTSLIEAMLHLTKVTSRMGRVEDGNTVSDYDSEEVRRKASVSASVVPIEWNNSKINFMDTPGFFDFVGAVKETLSVSDAALLLVSAKSGVEVGTELAWENAQELPRIFFVNGMDAENVDFTKVVADMRDKFGSTVAPLQIPFSEGGKVVGYIDAFTGKAYKWDKENTIPCDIPADMVSVYEEHHAFLLEAIAETDESLMEKYFGDEEMTIEEQTRGLRTSIANGSLCPVLCGTATGKDMIGVAAMLDMLTTLLPPAAELTRKITVIKDGETISIPCSEAGPVCAFVFKTISDPFVGRLSVFRVYSGVIKKDTPLYNTNHDHAEKFSQIFILRGKDKIEVPELRAGDIGAILKLDTTNTQDTLATKAEPFRIPTIPMPESLLSKALVSKGKGDEDKVATSLAKILAEDKTVHMHLNKETKQTILSGVGEAQLDVIVNRLKARYKLDVELVEPLVPYREMIKGKVSVQGKFKKQSGGSGQYGDVRMDFEPSGDLTTPYVFEETVVGGSVPKQYFPAVEKGIQECVKAGPIAAYPVVGLKARLTDGSYHAVDSSELAFKMAAILAFRDGFMKAKPTLLEPIMKVVITVPEDYTGDIMGDMNKRRGRILGMDKVGRKQAIQAEAPHSEMLKYATDLRSMTQGRGSFTMEFERYDEAPSDVQQKVIAARKKILEEMKDKD